MADWVHAVERAYVKAATGGVVTRGGPVSLRPRAAAAIGAVASHYLAVGTPRSFGIVIEGVGDAAAAAESLVAHRAWFAPRDIRCAALGSGAEELASATGGRVVTVEEAFAADIVCVHGASVVPTAHQIRRGTHVNLIGHEPHVDPELERIATVTRETPGLGALAAGLVDGRQLDEITVFVVGDAAVALGALAELQP